MNDDFEIIESGESDAAKYDTDTNQMLEPDGTKRAPDVFEQVRAATLEQKASKDPVEKYRQSAARHGVRFEDVLHRVGEFDSITDPVERLRFVNKLGGVNDQAAASELFLRATGQSATQNAGEPTEAQLNAIAEFDRTHPDPLTRSLRADAVKILQSNDKRLAGAKTDAELLDRAFGIAWMDKNPTAKAIQGVAKHFEGRDNARDAARMAKKIDKAIG